MRKGRAHLSTTWLGARSPIVPNRHRAEASISAFKRTFFSKTHAQPYAETRVRGIRGQSGPCVNAKLEP